MPINSSPLSLHLAILHSHPSISFSRQQLSSSHAQQPARRKQGQQPWSFPCELPFLPWPDLYSSCSTPTTPSPSRSSSRHPFFLLHWSPRQPAGSSVSSQWRSLPAGRQQELPSPISACSVSMALQQLGLLPWTPLCSSPLADHGRTPLLKLLPWRPGLPWRPPGP